jgi:WD40 repeat protein
MAYIPGFTNDIFISYSHADNSEGWVDGFEDRLRKRLLQLDMPATLWRDTKLRGTDVFSDETFTQLQQSALLISIVSPRGVGSRWCEDERQAFERFAALNGGFRFGNKLRAIKVVKTPLLDGTHRDLFGVLGYEFFKREEQSHHFPEFDQSSAEFRQLRDKLAQDILSVLTAFRKHLQTASKKETVYLATTTRDLERNRQTMVQQLTDWGYLVVPQQSEPPHSIASFEAITKAELTASMFSVHLVSEQPKLLFDGGPDSIIAQYDLAQLLRKDRIVWVAPGRQLYSEFDDTLKNGLQNGVEILRDCALEDLKDVIEERINRLEPVIEPKDQGGSELHLILDHDHRSLEDSQGGQQALPVTKYVDEPGLVVMPSPFADMEWSVLEEEYGAQLKLSKAVIVYLGTASDTWFLKMRRIIVNERIRRNKTSNAELLTEAFYIGNSNALKPNIESAGKLEGLMRLAISEIGNPFPGLPAFEPEQSHLFFGRDEQIKDLIARLEQHRFLPIVGVSGSGKSSLVRAGLIPALTSTYDKDMSGWCIVVLRPGRNPMHELAATLTRKFVIEDSDVVLKTLQGSTAGLARIAQEHLDNKEKLLVVVDQFEELFRYGDHTRAPEETDEDAAFVKLLLAATGECEHPLPGFDDAPVYVVTTMRSDFLGKCSRFRGLPEVLNQTQYLIPRLTREQQRDVIEGPVGMAGAGIEPGLVQQLLNDLGDNPDQLPALQHALMATWEHSAPARKQGQAITAADYEAIGSMVHALNNDADKVYKPLSTNETTKDVTRRLFQRLVQPGAADSETRSPTPLSELAGITAAGEAELNQVISVFEERGFLTRSNDPDPIVDITHESLIRGWRQLKIWVDEEARSAAIYRRLADAAGLNAKNEAPYFVDPQLQLTLNWREQNKPNEAWAKRYDSRFDLAMTFLEKSKKKRYALKRARFTALVLGTLLVPAIAASIFAAIQWRRALLERDRSSQLLYNSNIYFASNALGNGQSIQGKQRLSELFDPNLRNLRGFEWFYLWRISHPVEATLVVQTEVASAVAFSPDGKMLAFPSGNKVKLWDTKARKELVILAGHSDSVSVVTFSSDGNTLASASRDAVKLWDVATRKEVRTLALYSAIVLAAAFSPDGRILAFASEEAVTFWDTANGKVLDTLSAPSAYFISIAFSPDGKTLAAANADRRVTLWDTMTRKQRDTFAGFYAFGEVAFSPDGKSLATASADKTVRLWNTSSFEQQATLSGHSESVIAMAFSPDGKTLASSSRDRTVKLWDTKTAQELATLSSHSASVLAVAFSPDGNTLASASSDGTVKLWDTARKGMLPLSGHSSSVYAVTFSPDGKIVASGSFDKSVKLWDSNTGKELTTLDHSDSVVAVAFSSDGTLASASNDTVRLWDTAGKELPALSGHSRVNSVAFSPDGKTLASASWDTTVKLWETATGKELGTLVGHSYAVSGVAFSPDGKALASTSADKTVKLWDIHTGKELATLFGHSDSVIAVTFSLDGKTLATASADKTVKLWDIDSRKELATLTGHSAYVSGVVFSPDGKTLASASADKTVKLWNIATRRELVTLAGHTSAIFAVAFTPDGKTLASASGDKTVRLWFAATEAEVEEQRRRDN